MSIRKPESCVPIAIRAYREDAIIGTQENFNADTLALINNYRDEHYPIEAIWIRPEKMQIKQVDLIPAVGEKTAFMKFSDRKRK